MKKFVCDLGGYEVLLHGNVNDARRAVIGRVGEHGPVTMHDDSLQRAVGILASWWRVGSMWWGPPTYARDAVLKWFTDHDLKGKLKPERERELAAIVLAAMKDQGVL